MALSGKIQNNHGFSFSINQRKWVSLPHLLVKLIFVLTLHTMGHFKLGILLFLLWGVNWRCICRKPLSSSFKFNDLHSDVLHLKSSTTFSQCLLYHAICHTVQLIAGWWSICIPPLALEWLWLSFRDRGDTQVILQGYVSPTCHIFWIHLWSFVSCLLCFMSVPCFSLTIYSFSILFCCAYLSFCRLNDDIDIQLVLEK